VRRLVEALQANFPALTRLLGERSSTHWAPRTCAPTTRLSFPSATTATRWRSFCANDPEYAAAPVLSELARWEWAMTEVFDAADAAPIDPDALARVSPEGWADLCFDWHPSVRRLELSWNAAADLEGGHERRRTPRGGPALRACQWLLWRHDLHTYFRSLSTPEAAALDAARADEPFGEYAFCSALTALKKKHPRRRPAFCGTGSARASSPRHADCG